MLREFSPRINNLEAAQTLYFEILKAGLNYGCLEVALTALGARISWDEVDRTTRHSQPLLEAIESRGFNVNWIIPVEKALSRPFVGSDISSLLNGEILMDEEYPEHQLAGHLWLQFDLAEPDHVLAILPAESSVSPVYDVVDTQVGGYHTFTADRLAHLANSILAKGGRFEIVQLLFQVTE